MPKYKKPILVLIVILLIATPAAVVKKRSSIYSYDVASDYEYSFEQSDVDITDLTLNDGVVSLGERGNAKQSAFLRVDVHTTFLGKYLQPSVAISNGQRRLTQYFEHGAEGTRYINITSLMPGGEVEIRLKGEHVSIVDQTVQLVRFHNGSVENPRILVLAPHPDDAEIAAYGLYSDNKESYIVTVTAGDAGGYKYDEIYQDKVRHYLKKGELRTWNSITVPMLGGIPPEQTVNLGFFDGTIKKMYGDKSSPVTGLYTNTSDLNTYRKLNVSSLGEGLRGKPNWDSLLENLGFLLKEIEPDVIVAPYPALDQHDDHKFSSVALFEAIIRSGVRDGQLYLYANHLALNEYYPYGKEGGTMSLPPNFENDLYFDGVYSHPLSIDKQKDKIFALESMNDLRPDTEWRFLGGAFQALVEKIERTIKGNKESHYRKSIRSNELFFVVEIGNLYDQGLLDRLIGKLSTDNDFSGSVRANWLEAGEAVP